MQRPPRPTLGALPAPHRERMRTTGAQVTGDLNQAPHSTDEPPMLMQSTARESVHENGKSPMKSWKPESRVPMIVMLLAIVLAALGCHHEEHHGHEEKGKFLVTSPLRKDTEITREYVSQIRAIQHIELRAQESGYLTGIFVDEGQVV
jgi:hypothetical protein